jgi:Nitric oxide synthase, oxygenase domain
MADAQGNTDKRGAFPSATDSAASAARTACGREPQAMRTQEHQTLLSEAEAYLRLFHQEHGILDQVHPRLQAIRREFEQTSTYWHTPEELAYGAQVAWRNSNCCIGRL